MRRLFLLVLFLASVLSCTAQMTTSLSGTLKGPDGTPFTGRLSIQLARPTAINTCVTPYQVVSKQQSILTVTSGTIVNGGSTAFVPNGCLQPSIPYYIELFDTNNQLVYSDNWFFPKTSPTTTDVGTLVASRFSGPIVVAIPLAIVGSPAGDQTVTQPNTSFLYVNRLTVTDTLVTSGTISGSVTGNAATATQLLHTPSKCGDGQFATGVDVFGNASCSNNFPTNSIYGSLQATGAVNSYGTQGAYINWNRVPGTVGETDFINVRGLGSGGFSWFNVDIANSPAEPIMNLDLTGNLTLQAVTANVVTAPTLTGNASTAFQLYSAPTTCPAGQYATGIQQNGNAICSPQQIIQKSIATSTCTTPGGSYNGCSFNIAWPNPNAFPDTNYAISCMGKNANNGRAFLQGITTKTRAGATVIINSAGDANVSFAEVDCIGVY